MGQPKLSDEQVEQVLRLRGQRVRQCRIAKMLGVHPDTVGRVLRRRGIAAREKRSRECAPDCSTPPPPPPGFSPGDLLTGKPVM